MKKLLVGFDSAWTRHKKGALACAITDGNGNSQMIQSPIAVDFPEAKEVVKALIDTHLPEQTVIFLDQPHIVANASGARPVERIISSLVSRRYGGMQSASTQTPESKRSMFGTEAPVWEFLESFGGPANPYEGLNEEVVIFETYPVLYLIANEWLRPDKRPGGKLPKYNPERRKTFCIEDWQFLCNSAKSLAQELNAVDLTEWFKQAEGISKPKKVEQDKLDAMLCLLQAVEWQRSDSFAVLAI